MRLFIADSDSSVRLALQLYLQQESGMYVIGIATEGGGLLSQLVASRPDVLLLDWCLPGGCGRDMLSEIGRLDSPPRTVVLSVKPEEEEAAISAGADAFVSKNALPDELMNVLRLLKHAKDL